VSRCERISGETPSPQRALPSHPLHRGPCLHTMVSAAVRASSVQAALRSTTSYFVTNACMMDNVDEQDLRLTHEPEFLMNVNMN
jgi:hypothetical protein